MLVAGVSVVGVAPFEVKPASKKQAAPWMVVGRDGANALACKDGLRMIFDDLYGASLACAEANLAASASPRRART